MWIHLPVTVIPFCVVIKSRLATLTQFVAPTTVTTERNNHIPKSILYPHMWTSGNLISITSPPILKLQSPKSQLQLNIRENISLCFYTFLSSNVFIIERFTPSLFAKEFKTRPGIISNFLGRNSQNSVSFLYWHCHFWIIRIKIISALQGIQRPLLPWNSLPQTRLTPIWTT